MPNSPGLVRPTGGTPWVRRAALIALVGPPVYVVAVFLGGLLWAGYSPYAETISTLTARGAPNQWILEPLLAFYNVTILALAFGLQTTVLRTRFGTLGPAFLAGAGAAGLLLFAFPQGPWSDPLSGTGVPHTIVAGFDALFFLLAMGFLWRRLQSDPMWHGYDRITLGLLVLGVILGGFGAASVAAPYAGLAERLSIGTFLAWSEALAVGLVRHSRAAPMGVADSAAAAAPA